MCRFRNIYIIDKLRQFNKTDNMNNKDGIMSLLNNETIFNDIFSGRKLFS